MNSNKIKVAQIGLNFGKIHHVNHISEFKDVDLYICDIDPQRLNETGARYNIDSSKCYLDYKKMLDESRPHAVILSMPQYVLPDGDDNGVYHAICRDILERKMHLMVEKPLAMSVAAANTLAALAAKMQVVSMVNVNRRFAPLLAYCLEKVRERGPVISSVCEYYKNEKIFPGQVSIRCDQIHAIDLLRYINGCDEIVSFNSSVSSLAEQGGPVAFQAIARFDNGATGLYSGGICAGARRERYQINGDGISCYLETCARYSKNDMVAKIYRNNNVKEPEIVYDNEVSGSDDACMNRGFVNSDRYFIECIKNGTQAHCSFADNAKNVELCNKILNN